MSDFFYAAATSLLLSFLLTPLLVQFLRRRRVLDEGGHRKIHKGFIPSMGGIIIFLAFLLATLLWEPIEVVLHRRFELAALILVFFAGIRDDIEPLRPMHKLVVQVIAAGMVVVAGDIRISSLYGLWGIEELPMWLSYCGSIVFVIFITNAFNLIDGLDGLAGTLAVFSFSFLCCWFYGAGNDSEAMRIACMIGAVLGFLYYNWQPASLFMGDTGSLVIGFMLSVSTLSFIRINGSLPDVSYYKFPAVLSAGLAVVLLPAFDTIRVFLLRLRQRRSPFLPDKQHVHHVILHLVQTHAKAVRLIIVGYLIIAGLILYASKYLLDDLLLLLIVVFCISINVLIRYVVNRSFKKEQVKKFFVK
ncbi:MAG: undecaprenyl/decaprenyl-phosphate alpha-N-acetylglucosaminyl 1-phosphate transferase [Prevotellaceae bacterium]|jgi:UDP-N-acetylmuramyl pentapeptide phosphotransferase/UDP-N-acetylglucosamine-1-phosphate transferase|nr:undecaprenyl/decaprenyl-phosphate alpha-N-acetylglucosaminyl 1-phosphate transferase [Prevotellaceae bacterium]